LFHHLIFVVVVAVVVVVGREKINSISISSENGSSLQIRIPKMKRTKNQKSNSDVVKIFEQRVQLDSSASYCVSKI
jgi:hypothetical protein